MINAPTINFEKEAPGQKPKKNNHPQIIQSPESRKENYKAEIKRYDPLESLVQNTFFKTTIPAIGNTLALAFNLVSSYANSFSKDNKFKDFATKLGSLGNKIFYSVNGSIIFLEQLVKKNYLSAFGNLLEVPLSLGFNQTLLYLVRGLSVGLYTLANSMSILNKKDSFEHFPDHVQSLYKGLKKSIRLLIQDPVKNILSSETGLLGNIGGLFSISGFLSWFFTNNEKIGGTIRDFGGILMDLEQAKPEHLKNKRPYYFSTGLTYIASTALDLVTRWVPNTKKRLTPIVFALDMIARNFLRVSQNKGELR